MLSILVTILLYLGGAITERESNGKLTQMVYIYDSNITAVECTNAK